MEIKQIRYFLELARLEHMAQAADELGIAQPTLSKSLNALEKELGVRLFDRIGNRIRLNRSGEQFRQYASTAIQQLDTATLSARQSLYETSGSIQIACVTFAPILLPPLQDYLMLNPNISVNVIQYGHEKSQSGTFSDYDFLLTTSYNSGVVREEEDSFWIPQTLFSEETVLVVGPKHPMYDQIPDGLLDLRLLHDSDFITMRLGGSFKEITYALCEEAGFFPRSTFQTDDFLIKMGAIREGIGVAFLPEACLIEAEHLCPGLKHFHLARSKGQRSIILQRKKKRLLSEAALDFWDYILDFYQLPADNRD